MAGSTFPPWAANRSGIDRVGLEERLAVVAEIAGVVADVHALSILRHNIKPSNILISEQANGARVIRLVYFGADRPLGTA